MNVLEIEEALSNLSTQPFDAVEFPFSFLAALGNKELALQRLRKGNTNKSDHPGGVLQHSHIHLAVCAPGEVAQTLRQLRDNPRTAQNKAKLILATDGVTLQAEDLVSGEPLACDYPRFADHFGFFLPLAGISTVKEIKENPIDVKATGRLTKLYVELLKNNPEWATDERRPDMNHFMARLVFCYFAEDTDIFPYSNSIFTRTLEQVTDPDGSNTDLVLETIFKAMNIPARDRAGAGLRGWADERFPYVNGGLFAGSADVPKFTRTARSYLLRAGELNWAQINPDIFGSMIQAVADEEERGSLGMHYTSVPNILKVLNPLFLDDLRAQLEVAGDNRAKLLNLRRRLARIRVFDPACGSGNFLVIAYKQLREIEAIINVRRGEPDLRTEIPLTNFRGIELRNFSAEIARLALIIAKFQCDVLYRGQKEALAAVLPLDSQNWIICGNALQMDWLDVCPPTGTGVKLVANDLFDAPAEQAEVAFENEGGETYICGNPPYYGSRKQEEAQKKDIKALCGHYIKKWKSLDYVAGWFLCAKSYMEHTKADCAFVATSSVCEGLHVSVLWPHLLRDGVYLNFGVRPFKWSNLATNNAGVTVIIAGLTNVEGRKCQLFSEGGLVQRVDALSPYLSSGKTIFIEAVPTPMSALPKMVMGGMPRDGGHLIMSADEATDLIRHNPDAAPFVRRYMGSDELINGSIRNCLWIEDRDVEAAREIPAIARRLEAVTAFRKDSPLESTQEFADKPHRFVYLAGTSKRHAVAVAAISSERRDYLPVDLLDSRTVISNKCFVLYDATLWNMAILASRLHLVWIAAVCGKLETRYSYSNTLGWNTFPVPVLTDTMKDDLVRSAQEILLAREAHYPATIAALYDPEKMPPDLKAAHERNDEVLERIYVGRRFRNDTERLERLFDLYTKMTATQTKPKKGAKAT